MPSISFTWPSHIPPPLSPPTSTNVPKATASRLYLPSLPPSSPHSFTSFVTVSTHLSAASPLSEAVFPSISLPSTSLHSPPRICSLHSPSAVRSSESLYTSRHQHPEHTTALRSSSSTMSAMTLSPSLLSTIPPPPSTFRLFCVNHSLRFPTRSPDHPLATLCGSDITALSDCSHRDSANTMALAASLRDSLWLFRHLRSTSALSIISLCQTSPIPAAWRS